MASESPGRLKQIGQMVAVTKQADPKYVPVLVVTEVVVMAVFFGLGYWLAGWVLGVVFAILTGLIAFIVVTGRRGQAAAYTRIEGQVGAAAAILDSLRGDWRVTPAVAFNRNQDVVHRVVGRAGVILVGEGRGAGVRQLMSDQLRRIRKVVGDAPLHDIVVGEGEGQVPLRRLQAHVMKLPRTLKPREVNAVDSRLKALGGTAMPLPKGPVPTRMPRGGKVR